MRLAVAVPIMGVRLGYEAGSGCPNHGSEAGSGIRLSQSGIDAGCYMCEIRNVVEPLLKDTPEIRILLHKGHFAI